jgi:protein-S-isoprenylcysteine O-methyltransferase Ste14
MNNYGNIIVGCWIALFMYWSVTAFFTKRTKVNQSFSSKLTYGLLFAVSFWFLFAGFDQRSTIDFLKVQILSHSNFVTILGIAITIIGLFITIWARTILGRNWSSAVVLKKEHELIKRGPYGVVRHPIYTGLVLMYIGTAVAIGNLGGFIGLPLLIISLLIKIRQEEELMLKTFGRGYIFYRRNTSALIPYFY